MYYAILHNWKHGLEIKAISMHEAFIQLSAFSAGRVCAGEDPIEVLNLSSKKQRGVEYKKLW